MSSNKIHQSRKNPRYRELTEEEINRLADEIYVREFPYGKKLVEMPEEERRKLVDSILPMKKDEAYNRMLDEMIHSTRRRMAHELPADWMGADYWNEDDNEELDEPETEEKEISIEWYRRKVLRICAAAAVALIVVFFGGHMAYNEYARVKRMASAGESFICGNDSLLLLSDGTKVTLQGGTRLVADNRFGEINRSVRIDGQGFMDVERDTLRPYQVEMPHGLSLTVLGTAFNINAYADSPLSEITVSRGCVAIRNSRTGREYGRFYKGERFTYNSETGEAVRSRTTGDATAWIHTEGFVLHGASVEEFRQMMFQQYGAEVIIKGDAIPQDAQLYCDLSPEKPTLGMVLAQVCRIYAAHSRVDGRKITIYK